MVSGNLPDIVLGALLAILLHEIFHYLGMLACKVRIRAFVLTWWTALGFIVVNEDFVTNARKLAIVYFLPLSMCPIILINPTNWFFIVFFLGNILGGVGDMYFYFRLMSLEPGKRVEWANKTDERMLRTAVWKRFCRQTEKEHR